jgi:hypothetical protein
LEFSIPRDSGGEVEVLCPVILGIFPIQIKYVASQDLLGLYESTDIESNYFEKALLPLDQWRFVNVNYSFTKTAR